MRALLMSQATNGHLKNHANTVIFSQKQNWVIYIYSLLCHAIRMSTKIIKHHFLLAIFSGFKQLFDFWALSKSTPLRCFKPSILLTFHVSLLYFVPKKHVLSVVAILLKLNIGLVKTLAHLRSAIVMSHLVTVKIGKHYDHQPEVSFLNLLLDSRFRQVQLGHRLILCLTSIEWKCDNLINWCYV